MLVVRGEPWHVLSLAAMASSRALDRNPALPRTTKAQTAASAELRSPSWPVAGLS